MTVKWYLDPGHGGDDPGAVSQGFKYTEKDINLIVSKMMYDYMKNNYDVDIRMSRQTDKTLSLSQRTDDANSWGADYFISVHFNAFDGVARGYEDFIFRGLSDTSGTARFRDAYHGKITDFLSKHNIPNRGKKKSGFYVLRNTSMSAILLEFLFLDNDTDQNLILKKGFLEEYVQVVCDALADATGVKKVSTVTRPPKIDPSDEVSIYRVIVDGDQVGAWRDRENLIRGINSSLDKNPEKVIVERV